MKSQTKSSLKWSAIERLAAQVVQLIIMLYLAKLLGPEAFGLVGMLAIFIAICQVFVDSGFSSALIRKLDSTEIDYSTAFYFNFAVACLAYLALYSIAPLISGFYGLPELVQLARVLGCIVLITPFSLIQRTKLTVKMDFKAQAKASLTAVFCSSGVAIYMALNDFGAWALVGQAITMNIVNALMLNLLHPWLPRLKFSKNSLSYLFSFGSKLLLSGLIDTVYKNIYQIFIGKKFDANEVGLFTQANQLSSMPAKTLTTIIQRVTYPLLSKMQENEKKLEQSYLITLKLAALVIFPLMIGLAFSAPNLVPLLLGDEWLRSAWFVSILCFGFMLLPIHAINLNLLQVKNRTDLFLKLEIIKKTITTVILFITLPIGVEAICYGIIVQSYISLFINTYYTGRLTKLTIIRQSKELLPIWAGAIVANASAYYFARLINDNLISQVVLLFIFAPILYLLLMLAFEKKLVKQFLSLTISIKSRA